MGQSQTAAGVLAILCGFVAACLMSTKHLFIRMFKSNYSGVDMGIDASMIEFAIFCIVLYPLSQEMTIGWRELGIGAVAGCLICASRIFISIGISTGLAAPAQALMSTHAFHQARWSAVVAGQTLTFFQILGLVFGILAVFSISYFDQLAKKIKNEGQLKQLHRSLSDIEVPKK